MKKMNPKCRHALAFAALLATAGFASAQSTVTTTSSTTSNGTISEFSPSSITVRTDSGVAPLSYSYSKTTTYVDESGNPVSVETVRSGVPVTVYYTRDGDRMLASKVIVHRSVTTTPDVSAPVIETRKTTTTTTTSGQ